MNVKWEDVKDDYARKDAEIAALKAGNEAFAVEMLNHFYCEASQGGAGHSKATEYAKMRLANFKAKA